MKNDEILQAIETIKKLKARYFRGVDTEDGQLVRDILAEDCMLDYRGCFTDPTTKKDFFPALNMVLNGKDSWSDVGLAASGIVSVHQGHTAEIDITSEHSASAIWSMTDRLFMPQGSTYHQLRGFGYYHETYEKIDTQWQLKTLRISRIRVEGL